MEESEGNNVTFDPVSRAVSALNVQQLGIVTITVKIIYSVI